MKEGIHPDDYRYVVFKDMSNDHVFRNTKRTSESETLNFNASFGYEYDFCGNVQTGVLIIRRKRRDRNTRTTRDSQNSVP